MWSVLKKWGQIGRNGPRGVYPVLRKSEKDSNLYPHFFAHLFSEYILLCKVMGVFFVIFMNRDFIIWFKI